MFGGLQQFRALSSGLRKPVVSHHGQIYGPVHGAITHENSATMSLYRYDLVEASLVYQSMKRVEWTLYGST
jgi:hypothetical protein